MYFLPKRNANRDFLSLSEIEALNAAIEENEALSFGQLMSKSHDNVGGSQPHGQRNKPYISHINGKSSSCR